MTATFTKAHLPDVVHMEDNIWAMLPEDLLNEILARVSPFMIFRLRSICRRWNSILQDNGFLRFHSQVPSHGPCLLTFWKNLNVPQCTVFSLPLKQWYKIPFMFLPPWAFWLVGASGGLVCFSGLDGLNFMTLICNPLTQRWRMLPSMHYNQQRHLIMVVDRRKRCLHASSSPQRCSYGGGDIEAGKRSAEIELDEFFKKVQHIEKEFDKLNKLIRKLQVDCDEHKSVCTKFGVSGYPTIQWFPKGSLEPKKYEGARTAEALVEFVNLEGGTNAKIASVPSIVVILNSDNFDEIVLNGNKDVLVEFYAPWCGHCKILAPRLTKLLQLHSKINLDADNHKDLSEKYGVSGYPTIKFFPKTNKDGEDYEGGRDIDSFVTLRVGQFGVW